MKQVLIRELQEYDLRELFGNDYTDDLCNELYEKSGVMPLFSYDRPEKQNR